MIGRMATEQAVRNFLSDLQGNYRSLADSQRQVATGKRILTPSDDPVGVAIGPDGALLVADDVGDAIWRVTAAG